MFFLWALVVGVLLWRGRDQVWKRAFAGLAVLTAVYVALIVSRRGWRVVPHILYNGQFTWRLHSYVLMGTALLVLAVLRWHATAPEPLKRWATVVFVVFALFNVGTATWQVWEVRSEYVRNKHEVVAPSDFADQVVASRYNPPLSWYAKGDFRDVTVPPYHPKDSRIVKIPVRAVHRSRYSGLLPVPDGPAPFTTNISAGPRFLRITGIVPIGRTRDGSVVAVRAAGEPATGPIEVTILPVDSRLLRLAAFVSTVCELLFPAFLLWAFVRFARVRWSPSTGARRPLP